MYLTLGGKIKFLRRHSKITVSKFYTKDQADPGNEHPVKLSFIVFSPHMFSVRNIYLFGNRQTSFVSTLS